MGSRSETDWHAIWRIEWCPWRNHLCLILCQSVKGFLGGSTPKRLISYTYSNDPYNSSALPCRLWYDQVTNEIAQMLILHDKYVKEDRYRAGFQLLLQNVFRGLTFSAHSVLTSLACVVLCSGFENACILSWRISTTRDELAACVQSTQWTHSAVYETDASPPSLRSCNTYCMDTVGLSLLIGQPFARLVCPVYISTFLVCILCLIVLCSTLSLKVY